MKLYRSAATAIAALALTIPGGVAHASSEIESSVEAPIVIEQISTPTVYVLDCSATVVSVTFKPRGGVDEVTGPQVSCSSYPEFML